MTDATTRPARAGSDLPLGAARDTTRDRPEGFFLTPDTAPPGLSVKRARWVAPLFLAAFALGVALSSSWFPPLIHKYAALLKELVGAGRGGITSQASVAVRPLFLLLILLFALLLSGSLARRLRFLVVTFVSFAVLCGGTDALLLKLSTHGFPGPFGVTGNVISGIEGIVALAVGIFVSAALPPGVRVREEVRRGSGGVIVLGLALAATVVSVMALLHYLNHEVRAAQRIPVVAGVGSGLVLFFGVLFFFLYWLDWVRPRRMLREGDPMPSVAIVVPARNEAGLITDCIRSIDEAARAYPNRCSVYVVENGSSDDTYEEAAEAIASVAHVRGVLLQCEPRGKAYALNVGISHADEDIVLRIDADTVITSSVLLGLMRHFSNDLVGGVSGLPLPRTRASWICRMRAIEVYYQVGFKRAGYNAVDSVGVLPGALVAYRRHLLEKLHGFAQGVNGEDADMTVRVGRLGYRIMSDPTVRAYTEMPTTFAYLREQRMRWSRGTYHMLARNKSGIAMAQGLRCVWVLPWAGFIMFRRLMILPFAAAAVALVFQSHSILAVEEVAAGGAIVLGFQLLQMAACMLFFGEVGLIADIPSYVVFRLIVSFYALETLLGLSFRPRPAPPAAPDAELARAPAL
jgi:cellulose synthase/poly-beta-1,6-N-acetylglucosamine synthase-like glycosyltransferase